MHAEARHGKPFIYMTFRSSAALSDIPVMICHGHRGAPTCRVIRSTFLYHAIVPARAASDAVSSSTSSPEILMRTSLSLAAALLFSTILVAPDIAAAAGEENPTPPSQTNQSAPMKKKVKKKTSSAEDFLKGYHAAYALIYDKGDYEAASRRCARSARRQRRRGDADGLRQPQARPL